MCSRHIEATTATAAFYHGAAPTTGTACRSISGEQLWQDVMAKLQDMEDGSHMVDGRVCTPQLVRGALRRYARGLPTHDHSVDHKALSISSSGGEAGGENEGDQGAGATRRSTTGCVQSKYVLSRRVKDIWLPADEAVAQHLPAIQTAIVGAVADVILALARPARPPSQVCDAGRNAPSPAPADHDHTQDQHRGLQLSRPCLQLQMPVSQAEAPRYAGATDDEAASKRVCDTIVITVCVWLLTRQECARRQYATYG